MQSFTRELPHPQTPNDLFISRIEHIPSVTFPQPELNLERQALASIQDQFWLWDLEGIQVQSQNYAADTPLKNLELAGGTSSPTFVGRKKPGISPNSSSTILSGADSPFRPVSSFRSSERGSLDPEKSLLFKLGNFGQRAESFLKIISGMPSGTVLVTPKKKARSRRGAVSTKRSEYIGVSRNGPHWQALITIKKTKTYIGSYKNEKDAAIAFDFYSLLLHSFSAKTNFSYTKEEILELIDSFRSSWHQI